MSANATCPYCQAPLNVTANVGEPPVVCPHCLKSSTAPGNMLPNEQPTIARDIRHPFSIRRHGRTFDWILWLLIGLFVLQIVQSSLIARLAPGRDGFDTVFWHFLSDVRYQLVCCGLLVLLISIALVRFFRHATAENEFVGERFLIIAVLTWLALIVTFGCLLGCCAFFFPHFPF